MTSRSIRSIGLIFFWLNLIILGIRRKFAQLDYDPHAISLNFLSPWRSISLFPVPRPRQKPYFTRAEFSSLSSALVNWSQAKCKLSMQLWRAKRAARMGDRARASSSHLRLLSDLWLLRDFSRLPQIRTACLQVKEVQCLTQWRSADCSFGLLRRCSRLE